MTYSLIYQLSVTPELRRHLRPFNYNKDTNLQGGKIAQEHLIKINVINELKQQKSQKDCLQKILKVPQQKRRRWALSCNLITILKQIESTYPTFDIQQIQQQQQKHCQKHQQKQLLQHQLQQQQQPQQKQQQQQQAYYLKI